MTHTASVHPSPTHTASQPQWLQKAGIRDCFQFPGYSWRCVTASAPPPWEERKQLFASSQSLRLHITLPQSACVGLLPPAHQPPLCSPSACTYYQQISTLSALESLHYQANKNPVLCRYGDHYQDNYKQEGLKQLSRKSEKGLKISEEDGSKVCFPFLSKTPAWFVFPKETSALAILNHSWVSGELKTT